ncbi:hypothetical protein NC00_05545 [Xanthomonas cannabis pv. phaseoli]|uniref:Uncharacterized protein n=1 Tax=Xanthomonas cannabis pv. phaseoli TaxID=1885902 RepID=A0AB34PC76_9XANT|nr:hypothetical protein NC00_05545 [Xanthomonas cannabis pv. phaseoli]
MPSPACLRRRWTHAARVRNACLQGDNGTAAASACVQRSRTHRSGGTAARKNGRPRIRNGSGKQQQHRHAGRQADPVCSRSRRRCRVFGRARFGATHKPRQAAARRIWTAQTAGCNRFGPFGAAPAPARRQHSGLLSLRAGRTARVHRLPRAGSGAVLRCAQ